MKKLVIVLAVLGLANVGVADLYVESFDTDNAGWIASRVNNSGGTTWAAASWSSTGGNPGGHVYGTVDNSALRLYGLNPADASAHGDMTGLTLTTDYKINGTVTGPAGATVRFYIGTYTGGYDYYVSNDTFSWSPNGETSWTTHQVALTIGNFVQWPNQVAGIKTFAQIVAAPEDIGLVFADGFTNNANLGFSSTGGATIYVDNFGVVPVPGAVLLGIIGLGVAGAKLRKHA